MSSPVTGHRSLGPWSILQRRNVTPCLLLWVESRQTRSACSPVRDGRRHEVAQVGKRRSSHIDAPTHDRPSSASLGRAAVRSGCRARRAARND
eukprot:scaffold37651_cov320-Isochrysis_galbana.AAC.1